MGGSGSSTFLLIFMALAIVGLFFMNSRARKRQAEATAFRSNLQPGQQVMTGSGMFGTVVRVDGDKVTLVSSGGQESVWLLAAIAKLVEDEEPDTEAAADGDSVADDAPVADAGDATTRYIADAADAPRTDLGPDGTATRDEKSR